MTSTSASTPARKKSKADAPSYIVVHPKKKPKIVAERARDARKRRRDNGQPSISTLDRALREVMLRLTDRIFRAMMLEFRLTVTFVQKQV